MPTNKEEASKGTEYPFPMALTRNEYLKLNEKEDRAQSPSPTNDELPNNELPEPLYDPDFYKQAACRGKDPDIFHPHDSSDDEEALDICNRCSVRVDCLIKAIVEKEDNGIWGATGAKERVRLRSAVRLGKITIQTIREKKSADPLAKLT